MKPKRKPVFKIEWMDRSHIDDVVAIEAKIFDEPWSAEELRMTVGPGRAIGQVGLLNGGVVSYLVYEPHRAQFKILNLGVHPVTQRCGIGRSMIEELAGGLGGRRNRITLVANEWATAAHLFLRAVGFKAVAVGRDVCGPGVAGYKFEFRQQEVADASR